MVLYEGSIFFGIFFGGDGNLFFLNMDFPFAYKIDIPTWTPQWCSNHRHCYFSFSRASSMSAWQAIFSTNFHWSSSLLSGHLLLLLLLLPRVQWFCFPSLASHVIPRIISIVNNVLVHNILSQESVPHLFYVNFYLLFETIISVNHCALQNPMPSFFPLFQVSDLRVLVRTSKTELPLELCLP